MREWATLQQLSIAAGAIERQSHFPLSAIKHPARSVALLRDFIENHHDGLALSPRFFHHDIGDALRQLAFLIDGAAGQHRDLD